MIRMGDIIMHPKWAQARRGKGVAQCAEIGRSAFNKALTACYAFTATGLSPSTPRRSGRRTLGSFRTNAANEASYFGMLLRLCALEILDRRKPRSEPAIFGLTAKIKSTANDQFVDEAADRFSRRGAMPQVRARTLSVNLALDDPPQHCSDPIAAA